MFNPVRSYKQYVQRLENKRKVFNPDKTLNLQELDRFVNGTPERPRTRPTYLLAKTRKLLGHTIVVDINDGKYGGELKQVANDLFLWCLSPGSASNTEVRKWLTLLATPKPVERDGEAPVKERSQTSSQAVINDGDDARSHVSSEDVSKRENVPKDVSKGIDPRGRRPLPLLRLKSNPTQPRNGVVHMVDGEVVPVKQ